MKSAFVTGGMGFLGLNLVEYLLNNEWDVFIFDLNISGIHFSGDNVLKQKNVHLIQGDITDINSCKNKMPENLDAIFHLAGDTSHWRYGNDRQTKINVEGTRNMVETALKKKAGRFIHTSSIAAYGFQPERISEETQSSALNAKINYFRTKCLAEEEVRKGIAKGLDAVILNPANIIGPYDFSGWSRFFFMIDQGKLAGAPPGSASFCHVHDVAKAHLKAFEKGRRGHNYLLGGSDATWLTFVREIGNILDRKVPEKPVPAFILKMLGRVSFLISAITRKEPDITPEKAELVCNDLICTREKAVNELDYESTPLRTMLEDCHAWLVREGQLVCPKRNPE